ncbi:MAG: S41 family peptidase [bacterium]|jgi:carboxyl-terminal processing protease|nr:S41 family peptidase [bacterium]
MRYRFPRILPLAVLICILTVQSLWANNLRQYTIGRSNFVDVTDFIVKRYEKEIDMAALYRDAWHSFFKRSWKDIEHVIPNSDKILEATVSPESASDTIRFFYATRMEEVLLQYARAQVEEVTPTVQDLWNEASNGLVSSLGDVYSQFLPAQEHQKLQDSLSGKPDEAKVFYGVGISIEWDTQTDLGVLVISPLPGGPAEKNDIRAGDIIIGVDGDYFKDWDEDTAKKLEKAIDLIKGEKDSQVTLTIKRPNVPEPLEKVLARAPINPDQLISKEMLDGEVGLIRLASFYAEAADDLTEAMRYLKMEGMKKLIFDLRFDPGGYLDQAVKVAEVFLNKGDLITYTQGRSSPYRPFYDNAPDEEGFADIPMVVLINQYSASASEVVTGALKDNHRAVVIGKTSFGKGSVQEVFTLKQMAGLRLTVAHYYSPSGVCIHEIGITPDLEVDRYGVDIDIPEEMKDKDYTHMPRLERLLEWDQQMAAAYKVLKGEIQIDKIRSLSEVMEEKEKAQNLAASTEITNTTGTP